MRIISPQKIGFFGFRPTEFKHIRDKANNVPTTAGVPAQVIQQEKHFGFQTSMNGPYFLEFRNKQGKQIKGDKSGSPWYWPRQTE